MNSPKQGQIHSNIKIFWCIQSVPVVKPAACRSEGLAVGWCPGKSLYSARPMAGALQAPKFSLPKMAKLLRSSRQGRTKTHPESLEKAAILVGIFAPKHSNEDADCEGSDRKKSKWVFVLSPATNLSPFFLHSIAYFKWWIKGDMVPFSRRLNLGGFLSKTRSGDRICVESAYSRPTIGLDCFLAGAIPVVCNDQSLLQTVPFVHGTVQTPGTPDFLSRSRP